MKRARVVSHQQIPQACKEQACTRADSSDAPQKFQYPFLRNCQFGSKVLYQGYVSH